MQMSKKFAGNQHQANRSVITTPSSSQPEAGHSSEPQ